MVAPVRTLDEILIEDSKLNEVPTYEYVDDRNAIEQINEISEMWNHSKSNQMIEQCKKSILDSIIKPFGLAGVIFQDQIGGDVNTIHNARKEIFATEEARKAHEERGEYKDKTVLYHSHDNYKNTNKSNQQRKEDGTLQDAYTGKTFSPNYDYRKKPLMLPSRKATMTSFHFSIVRSAIRLSACLSECFYIAHWCLQNRNH